jgi:hypothetical protein
MKKVVLSLVLFASIIAVNAQPRAIGLRGGWGGEVSYQHGLGDANMLQIDAGFPLFGGFHVVGTYNWVMPISSWQHAGSWNWYAGVGAGVGLGWWGAHGHYDGDHYYSSRIYGTAGIAGMVGVEYNFKFPLQLSVDYRPLIGFGFSHGSAWFNIPGFYNIAFSVRYKF